MFFQNTYLFIKHETGARKLLSGLFLSIALHAAPYAQNPITKLIMDVTTGPQAYYTSDAYSYYTRKGISVQPQQSLDDAARSFQATTKLAAMGGSAYEAIPAMLQIFPRAVHVSEVINVHYSGEGTFDDWVQTYVTNEKNKLLISAPFLDYATLSQCEQFIVSTPEVQKADGKTVTIPTKDLVTISVTHIVYFGAYALAGITGEKFGTDREQWQQWWDAKGAKNVAPSAAPAAAARPSGMLRSGQLFGDIVIRGQYRMFLSTGDNLVGRVEAKDDTSLILETTDGKAFTFRPSIIIKYEYLEPPKTNEGSASAASSGDSLPFSFDQLRARHVGTRQLEVRINSGMVFRGTLKQIDSLEMKLQVDSSTIPIARDVVLNIRLVPPQPKAPPVKQQPAAASRRDTVVVKNTESDDWGKPKPDLVYTGTITEEDADNLVIATAGAGDKKIPRGRIIRVVKNSTESYETIIRRYAEPLFCPDDMFLVDLPPGKQGRPFFKVCVDRYEYPNLKGTQPDVNVSYDNARALCHKRGKRLCTADEWQWACSGLEGYTFPYGWNPEKEKCNTDGNRAAEPSGSRHNCVSKFGGYDMTGNVFEWVTGPKKQPSIMGGPYSKCQTITEGVGGSAKPQSGFRCCKGN